MAQYTYIPNNLLLKYDCSHVIDEIFIGGQRSMSNEFLEMFEFTGAINLNATEDEYIIGEPYNFYKFNIDDHPDAYIYQLFPICNHLILNNGRILVTCAAGISRSATIVLSYLLACKGFTLNDAITLLSKRRSIIHPNEGFIKQLQIFEERKKKIYTIHR